MKIGFGTLSQKEGRSQTKSQFLQQGLASMCFRQKEQMHQGMVGEAEVGMLEDLEESNSETEVHCAGPHQDFRCCVVIISNGN